MLLEEEQEEESYPNHPQVNQAIAFMESVEIFVRAEGFSSSPIHEIKTQIELLNMGFDQLTNLGHAIEHTSLYVWLKNELNKRILEGEKHIPEYMAVETVSIKLPTFSGVYADWEDFKEAFEIDVHNKKRLSDPEKLRKLLSCLTGPPKDLVNCFKLTDDRAYEKAWAKLREQYDNSYEAFNEHIGRIFKQDYIRRGDTAGATKSIATIRTSVLAANKIVEDRNAIACAAAVHLIQLMDVETREQWRLNRKNNTEIPMLEEVSDFLLEKVKTWEEGGSGSRLSFATNHEYRESRKRTKDDKEFRMPFNRNEREYSKPRRDFRRDGGDDFKYSRSISCFKCQGNHYISNCKDFLKMTAQDKNTLILDRRLCGKCLRKQHFNSCTTRCWTCSSEDHNTIFCPKK